MAPNQCIQSAEAAKVSHLYLTLTKVVLNFSYSLSRCYKISYDTGKLGNLLEALVDLCSLQNLKLFVQQMMIVHRSLCVLHEVLKHILNMENNCVLHDDRSQISLFTLHDSD
ncbi:hypothetical protein E3N88_09423 [Mikania micrantha]|uniref:Uncharacterized protein n=1 Tax=Mikania micrantha TaxID=192012 RepID=A0A5N6PJW3_9ASTR|nr:hypothetical protein E3N88_09423 [Mikania micrantha]